jgi:hypothetical protein
MSSEYEIQHLEAGLYITNTQYSSTGTVVSRTFYSYTNFHTVSSRKLASA